MRSNSKRHIVRFKQYDKERFVNINNETEIANFEGGFIKRFNNRSNQQEICRVRQISER